MLPRMAETGDLPRDDRTWPRGAATFSVLVVLSSLAGVAWAVTEGADGPLGPVGPLAAFVVALGVEGWLAHRTFTALLAGGPTSAGQLPQVAVMLVALAALAVSGPVGAGSLCGVFAALFAVNLWARRRARANRPLVDAAERQATGSASGSATAPPVRATPDRPALDVGATLDAALRGTGQRWVAWLVSGGVVTAAVWAVVDRDSLPGFMVPFMAVGVLLWTSRALWPLWRARRDFDAARTPPQRAWVALVHDPAPRMIRPLLGVWTEVPESRGSVFARPELVFRCDDDVDALLSHQGSVVVHEAWVDTSRHGLRGARWVAADAGIAVPHRRALFGRWYFHSLTRAERPGPPEPLRTAQPTPSAPRDPSAETGDGPGLGRRVLWRTGALALLAVVAGLFDPGS